MVFHRSKSQLFREEIMLSTFNTYVQTAMQDSSAPNVRCAQVNDVIGYAT